MFVLISHLVLSNAFHIINSIVAVIKIVLEGIGVSLSALYASVSFLTWMLKIEN